MSGRVETVPVIVGSSDYGGFNIVSGRKKERSRQGGDRILWTLTAVLLALSAIIALSSQYGARSVSEVPLRASTSRHMENNFHSSTTSKAPMRKSGSSHAHAAGGKAHKPLKVLVHKVNKQALAEAFSSYNKKTGYLVNRYWDWGLDARFYMNVDPRVPSGELVRSYEPEAEVKIKHLDMDNYTMFKARAETKASPDGKSNKAWYPSADSPKSARINAIITGTIKIDTAGNYTFLLKANTGAKFTVTDMKTEKTAVGTVGADAVDNSTVQSVVLKAPSMANLVVEWHSPPVGTDHVLHLQYSGPDTDGAMVDVAGARWLNDKDTPRFKPLDPSTLHPGFGCRFTYPANLRTEVPEDLRNMRNITPDLVAQVPSLEIKNHEDMVDLVSKAKDLGGAGDLKASHVPERQVLAYCEGYINISAGGGYVFEAKNDGGVKVTIDLVTVVDNRTEHDPTVALPVYDPSTASGGPITLPKGYHQVRVGAIMSKYRQDSRPMGQSLALSYKGPDTLGGLDASVDDGHPTVPVSGIYQDGGFGDVGDVRTRSGKSRKPKYLGGGGSFTPERNPLENFDKDWYDENKDKPWKKYDFEGEDWDKDINDVANKIVKPWTDYTKKADAYAEDGATRKIPDAVYEKPPPYDPAVVDIGGKGIAWTHKEMSNDLSGHVYRGVAEGADRETAVIGSDYVFHPWDKTINSVPEPAMNLDMPESREYGGGYGTPPTTFGGLKGK